jgi:hypothetical protein
VSSRELQSITLVQVKQCWLGCATSISDRTLQPAEPRRFMLAVRVPEWAPEMTTRLSTGEIYRAEGGEYLRITRLWKSGERVDLSMGLAVRFAEGGRSYPGHLAVERGPLVLALEKSANLELRDIQSAALKHGGEPLSEERVGVYSLAGVVSDGDQKGRCYVTLGTFRRRKRVSHLDSARPAEVILSRAHLQARCKREPQTSPWWAAPRSTMVRSEVPRSSRERNLVMLGAIRHKQRLLCSGCGLAKTQAARRGVSRRRSTAGDQ